MAISPGNVVANAGRCAAPDLQINFVSFGVGGIACTLAKKDFLVVCPDRIPAEHLYVLLLGDEPHSRSTSGGNTCPCGQVKISRRAGVARDGSGEVRKREKVVKVSRKRGLEALVDFDLIAGDKFVVSLAMAMMAEAP